MTVKYRMISKRVGLKGNKTFWFARAVPSGEIDLAGLARHMGHHNTPYSEGQIMGVLQDFVQCFSEALQDGSKVKLEGLGLFGIGMNAKQVAKPGDWDPQQHIMGFHLCANLLASQTRFLTFLGKKKLQELPLYNVNLKDKSTEDPAKPNP